MERARAREAELANEYRHDGCPSPQHLDVEGARVRARRVYDQIQQGKMETPIFPRASQNVVVAAMIIRMAPEPSTDEGKRVHKELQDLLEITVVQQAQSYAKRRYPEASLVHISSAHGATEGYHAPSILQHHDDMAVCRWKPSPAHSHYVRNHNARSVQGARHHGPHLVGRDLPHYRDSDPDNHGRHPRIRDARSSPIPDACGPQAFARRIRQTLFLTWFRAPLNIIKYSRDTNPAVWLEDFRLACRAGGVDNDLFIIQYLVIYLKKCPSMA
jgi:hypothetical protein